MFWRALGALPNGLSGRDFPGQRGYALWPVLYLPSEVDLITLTIPLSELRKYLHLPESVQVAAVRQGPLNTLEATCVDPIQFAQCEEGHHLALQGGRWVPVPHKGGLRGEAWGAAQDPGNS